MTTHPSELQPEPATAAASSCGRGGVSQLHPDIIRTHILSRLDGPGLASAACASSQLCRLCCEDELWRDICTAAWPSTADPKVHGLISAFRLGYRSFYTDAYPLLHLPAIPSDPSLKKNITKLISAVDVFYGGNLLFSKVMETDTSTPWFMSAPFRIDLLEPKEPAKRLMPEQSRNNQNMMKHLEENLKLSWILIDPAHERAVNLPSRQPVSVCQDWLNNWVLQVRFSNVLRVGPEESELVECRAVLTCSQEEPEGTMEVREINLRMEDTQGRGLSGHDSLAVLAAAMTGEKRTVRSNRGLSSERTAAKERFKEFGEVKMRRREREQRRERALDMACMGCGIAAVVAYLFLWLHVLFSYKAS